MENHEFKTLKFCTLLLLCASSSAKALTWSEVKAKALETAPSIITGKAEVGSADAAIDRAKAEFLPSVSSSLSASRRIDSGEKTSSNTYDAGIALDQSLFSFGKTRAQLNAAKSGKQAALSELKLSSVTLRAKLAKAWSKVIYLQELAKLGEKNTVRREANLQIVKLRYQGGRENKGSVLRTEAAKLQTSTESEEAKANLESSKGELSVLIGQDIDRKEIFSGDIETRAPAIPELKNHPHLEALLAKQKQADATLVESRRKYFPDLSLSASANKSATPNLPLKDPIYQAEVTLKIPVFNPSTSADVSAALAKSKTTSIALAEASATQKQKALSTASAFSFARQKLEVARKIFEATKLQAEVSRQRYTLGMMSFQDWDSYESDLMRSEGEVLRAKYNLSDAHADYLEAIGIALEEGP